MDGQGEPPDRYTVAILNIGRTGMEALISVGRGGKDLDRSVWRADAL
jgi:hypothetical protein